MGSLVLGPNTLGGPEFAPCDATHTPPIGNIACKPLWNAENMALCGLSDLCED
jgi:hypothetical protein